MPTHKTFQIIVDFKNIFNLTFHHPAFTIYIGFLLLCNKLPSNPANICLWSQPPWIRGLSTIQLSPLLRPSPGCNQSHDLIRGSTREGPSSKLPRVLGQNLLLIAVGQCPHFLTAMWPSAQAPDSMAACLLKGSKASPRWRWHGPRVPPAPVRVCGSSPTLKCLTLLYVVLKIFIKTTWK